MNAKKYGNNKPVLVKLIPLSSTTVRLTVTDHGIGIDQREQDRIFERFERATNVSDISGMGLGLYISKQIIELHSGCISVTSESGKGSTFIVDLPVYEISKNLSF